MQDINFYAASALLGLILIGILFLSFFLSGLGKRIWAWVDDVKPYPRNPMVEFLLIKVLRYELNTTTISGRVCISWPYRNKTTHNISEGTGPILLTSLALFVVPMLVVLIIDFFHFTLCIAGFFAIAFITRAGRRGQKLLKSHIADKTLHSPE